MSYDNTNSGVLFQNDKGDNDKRPDYKGKLNVDGKDYELAGWKRQKGTTTYLSLKISEPKVSDSQNGWEEARSKFKPDTVVDAPDMTDEEFLNSIPF